MARRKRNSMRAQRRNKKNVVTKVPQQSYALFPFSKLHVACAVAWNLKKLTPDNSVQVVRYNLNNEVRMGGYFFMSVFNRM